MTHTADCSRLRHAGLPVRQPPRGLAALALACALAAPAWPVMAAQTASGAISGAAAPGPAAPAAPATAAAGPAAMPALTTTAPAAAAGPAATAADAAAGGATATDTAPAARPPPAAAPTPYTPAGVAGAGPWARGAMRAPTAGGSILQTMFSLIIVLAILVGLAWLLKRYGPKTVTGNANVKLVGALSVGARERILVVEVGEQWIVVGASPGRMNALATMPRQEGEPALQLPGQTGQALPTANFAEWFKQTIEKRHGK